MRDLAKATEERRQSAGPAARSRGPAIVPRTSDVPPPLANLDRARRYMDASDLDALLTFSPANVRY